ncbi:hypothetical protein BJ165DRAFT_1531840 [Panaeolus papilionaceus]|nr:hypothetical protein BJ165DRAFT_1531840 [Panaeolus papilionaceus]
MSPPSHINSATISVGPRGMGIGPTFTIFPLLIGALLSLIPAPSTSCCILKLAPHPPDKIYFTCPLFRSRWVITGVFQKESTGPDNITPRVTSLAFNLNIITIFSV